MRVSVHKVFMFVAYNIVVEGTVTVSYDSSHEGLGQKISLGLGRSRSFSFA